MSPARLDLRALPEWLDRPDNAAWVGRVDPSQLIGLRADLAEAVLVDAAGGTLLVRGDRRLGRLLPHGSVALYAAPAGGAEPRRLLELDRLGGVHLAVRRDRDGALHEAWVRNVDGALLGVIAGGAEHPLWGASDRIVRLASSAAAEPELLTVSGALDWDRIASIPPLADPTRLPPGAGTTILNMLSALAADQGAAPLRYRGPFATEQLFWALAEGFRFARVPDPLAAFLDGAAAAFAAGALHEAPLDWTPTPHERLFLPDGVYVQLRNGVEKVWWEGRAYYRLEWQGLTRREHRIIRRLTAPDGRLRFVATLHALGHPLQDHLVLDADGTVIERPAAGATEPGLEPDVPLAGLWREALGTLLPLEATPLLAPAIEAVWPALEVVWGTVPRDLVDVRGRTVRLSRALTRCYAAERARLAGAARRTLAQRLVREVLGLLGPPVRRAAAAWLEGEPPSRQQALLDSGAGLDRPAAALGAAERLRPLIDALTSGDARVLP